MNRLAVVLVLVATLVGPSLAGDVVIDMGDGTAIVTLDGRAIRLPIVRLVDPGPAPNPPGPTPPGPTPPVPPSPDAFGTLSRVLVLYETSASSGREAFYSDAWVAEVGKLVAKLDGSPAYRCWDWDLDASKLPGWVPFREAAGKAWDRSKGPALFAWDSKGAIRVVPITPAETVEGLLEKLRTLK